MMEPPPTLDDAELLDQITGSMLGMAIGDALGAHVEFRPHEYLVEHPVTELDSGGTWGLAKGQVNDPYLPYMITLDLSSSRTIRRWGCVWLPRSSLAEISRRTTSW